MTRPCGRYLQGWGRSRRAGSSSTSSSCPGRNLLLWFARTCSRVLLIRLQQLVWRKTTTRLSGPLCLHFAAGWAGTGLVTLCVHCISGQWPILYLAAMGGWSSHAWRALQQWVDLYCWGAFRAWQFRHPVLAAGYPGWTSCRSSSDWGRFHRFSDVIEHLLWEHAQLRVETETTFYV